MEQRYTAPTKNNPYYLHVDGGGYNRCIKISGNNVLPNCVGYAYGRFMEEAGITRCNLSTGNAQNWFGFSDGYERGQTPKQGAVMCWDKKPGGKYGHVAIVEEIHADGSVTASMSNYPQSGQSLPYWERKTYSPPYNTSKGLPFQGFIYNPYVTTYVPIGASDIEINGHKYALYRQGEDEEPVVLSAGLNKVLPIKQLDADVYVMAKVTGANYFQMRNDTADEVNTTYGDLSAPLNNVWTEVPNQDTTLYFDIETGVYGDCTGIHIDKTHNVYSPAVVYPKDGNYQYARMVGVGHVNIVSRYTFAIRFKDGTYAIGIALQDMTPKQIATDIRNYLGSQLDSISFLDGGGSAQFGRWCNDRFEYVRDTGRECPSAFAIARRMPAPVPAPDTGDEQPPEDIETPTESEDEEMSEPNIEPQPIDGWTDPEPQTNVIVQRIAALLSVKSIITIALTVAFIMLVVEGKELPDQFVSIYTMCISFFFGYQFKKAEKE